MDSSVDRARVGLANTKTRRELTEAKLRELLPSEQAYKVSDGGNGLYVVISPSGIRSFRYDYRLSGRRETLTIGRHEPARHGSILQDAALCTRLRPSNCVSPNGQCQILNSHGPGLIACQSKLNPRR